MFLIRHGLKLETLLRSLSSYFCFHPALDELDDMHEAVERNDHSHGHSQRNQGIDQHEVHIVECEEVAQKGELHGFKYTNLQGRLIGSQSSNKTICRPQFGLSWSWSRKCSLFKVPNRSTCSHTHRTQLAQTQPEEESAPHGTCPGRGPN